MLAGTLQACQDLCVVGSDASWLHGSGLWGAIVYR